MRNVPIRPCLLGLGLGLGLAAAGSGIALGADKALLIAIDRYERPYLNLKGCGNDIDSIERILVEDFGLDRQTSIRILRDSAATRRGILDAMREWLVAGTAPGDTALIYYSGHGSYVHDVDGDEARRTPGDHLDETLAPYDVIPPKAEEMADPPPNPTMIVDDEISKILEQLQGRRVVVIFDSCHSGTATKDVAALGTRSLPPQPTSVQGKEVARQQIYDAGRDPLVDSRFESGVLFAAAAGPGETAKDGVLFENKAHGAFTAKLLEAVQQKKKAAGACWGGRTNLLDLLGKVSDALKAGKYDQTPALEGSGSLRVTPLSSLLGGAAATCPLTEPNVAGSAFNVKVWSSLEGSQGPVGAPVVFSVRSDRAGYLYLFQVKPGGPGRDPETMLLHPRSGGSPGRIPAKTRIFVPPENEQPFTLRPPAGEVYVTAIVSPQPIQELERLSAAAKATALNRDQVVEASAAVGRGLAVKVRPSGTGPRPEAPQGMGAGTCKVTTIAGDP